MKKTEPKREPPPHSGWPPGLLQDDCRKLAKWFASRPGARRQAAEATTPHLVHHKRVPDPLIQQVQCDGHIY